MTRHFQWMLTGKLHFDQDQSPIEKRSICLSSVKFTTGGQTITTFVNIAPLRRAFLNYLLLCTTREQLRYWLSVGFPQKGHAFENCCNLSKKRIDRLTKCKGISKVKWCNLPSVTKSNIFQLPPHLTWLSHWIREIILGQ